MNSIEWLKHVVAKNGDRVFLIDAESGASLTFNELDAHARRIAWNLRERGLAPGDRAVMVLENSMPFALLYFGCLYAGVVAVPINPILSKAEIEYIASHCQAKLLVVSPATSSLIGDATRAAFEGRMLSLATSAASVAKGLPLLDVSALPACPNGYDPFTERDPEDIMMIVYTSGTTAFPKGVVHRIADVIGNARMFDEELGIGPDNRFYNILAMAYLGGYYNLLMLPFAAGSSVVLSRAFDAVSALDFWTPAIKHGVNTLWVVPTIMSILLKLDRSTEGEKYCRENMRLGLVGTAPLPVTLRKEFETRYGVSLYENYGLSETFFLSSESPKVCKQEGCIGRVMPGVQMSVMDADGRPLPYGEEGELFIRTPHLMVGYFEPNESFEELDRQSWFPTGDIGILTATGDVFVTGRKKDLIIRGGINISPAAIENELLKHASVSAAAVVGIPHETHGEEVVAVLELKPSCDIDTVRSELQQMCDANLGAVRRPAHYLQIDEFPKSATGKVQKGKLREIVCAKLGVKQTDRKKPAPESTQPKGPEILKGRIRRQINRPRPDLVSELAKFPTSIVSDSMNRMGVMDGCIRPLVRGRKFAGSAITVEEVEGGNLMSHAALELILPGDVLVIDAKGATTRSCWGGLQTFMAKQRGAVGIVVFGAVRDYEDIVECGMPVYAIGTSPGGPLKGWGGNVNQPIACAGLSVSPGDIVMGDDDGVIVVPMDQAEQLPAICKARETLEKEWFKRVEAGEATIDVVGLRTKLDSFARGID